MQIHRKKRKQLTNIQAFFKDLKRITKSSRPDKLRLSKMDEEEKELFILQLNKQTQAVFKGKLSEHHVIPGNMINKMLQTASEQKNMEHTCKIIEKFINQNPIVQIISQKYLMCVSQAQIIHSLIYWNEANLFMGPEELYRESQPRQNVDVELLKLQSKSYIKQIEQVMELIEMKDPQALEEFIKLSNQHKRIKWSLNGKTGLYRADEAVYKLRT